MKVGISKNGKTIELEDSATVFSPSIASVILLCSVNDADIKDKYVADIGCGTGYLGLGLLARGAARLYGTDIQPEAVRIARNNAALNHFEKSAAFEVSDFCAPNGNEVGFACQVDVVISNPPQTPRGLAPADASRLPGVDGGVLGNDKILNVLEKARRWLAPGGVVYIPIFSYSNPDQTKGKAAACFKQVEKIASHDIIFDARKLAHEDVVDHICRQGHGYRVAHSGHPYWRIEIWRGQCPMP